MFFEKYLNMKFHENPSSGSQVVRCGQTDGRTDMTKLAVAFRNFAKQLKNLQIHVAFDHSQKYLNKKVFRKFRSESSCTERQFSVTCAPFQIAKLLRNG
jgi:predicted ferric reductase